MTMERRRSATRAYPSLTFILYLLLAGDRLNSCLELWPGYVENAAGEF